MSPATWQQIQAHLVGEGLMSEQGVTKKPKHRRCRGGCGLVLLAAIDDLGLDTYCWPHPTTVPGELAALMAGLLTLTVVDGELIRRDHRRIGWRDADREAAYVQHRCGDPPPPINELHRKKARNELPANAPAPF